jgi:hypothetical protein
MKKKLLIFCCLGLLLTGCGDNACDLANQVKALFPDGDCKNIPGNHQSEWIIRNKDGSIYYALNNGLRLSTNQIFGPTQ